MKITPASAPISPVSVANMRAAPNSRERFSGLLRRRNVKALGRPNVRALARKTGQRIMAANSPRPAGCRARAERMPVAALIAMMKNFAPTDCTTAPTELSSRARTVGSSAGNGAAVAANILDVPVLKSNVLAICSVDADENAGPTTE